MSSTAPGIPMQSLPPPGAQTSGTTTSNQTHTNQQASGVNTSGQGTPPNAPSSQPSNSQSQVTPPQQPLVNPSPSPAGPPGKRWEILKRWLRPIGKVLLAATGAIATYIALSLSIWTSVKDYRDDCRGQNVTLGQLTKQCQSALSKPLSMPPLSSLFDGKTKRWIPRLIRDAETDSAHSFQVANGTVTSLTLAFGLMMLLCALYAAVSFSTRLISPWRSATDISSSPPETPTRPRGVETQVSGTWMDSEIPRPSSAHISSMGQARGLTLRKPYIRDDENDELGAPPKKWNVLYFRSPGFELYLPPTAFSLRRPRFLMLDNSKDRFYDVDYETPLLGNTTPWETLALHRIFDPAIVFAPEQRDMLREMNFAIGLLVAIEARDEGILTARKLGSVYVKQMPPDIMNSELLKQMKGNLMSAELKAGLLTRVWDRRLRLAADCPPYVTPGNVLDHMPRPWHRQGSALNYELDRLFVGCKPIPHSQRWRVHGLDDDQMNKSRTRAPDHLLLGHELERDSSALPTTLADGSHDDRGIMERIRGVFLRVFGRTP